MELFVDESGNLGKKERFFVIALLYAANKKRIKNIAKHFTHERKSHVELISDVEREK